MRLIPGISELLADKGYDSNAFRKFLKNRGIKPVIPGKSNLKKKIRHDKEAYKNRNVVERCFCRLKDFSSNALRQTSIRLSPDPKALMRRKHQLYNGSRGTTDGLRRGRVRYLSTRFIRILVAMRDDAEHVIGEVFASDGLKHR